MSLLAILLVSFSVVMGFYLLTAALQDQQIAMVLLWTGRVMAVMLVTNIVAVVIALGMHAISRD